MKRHEEYISGPHDFWVHFWFGLVFGGIISTWLSVSLFESAALILATAGIGALLIAYCCGRWGDPAWRRLIEYLRWTK